MKQPFGLINLTLIPLALVSALAFGAQTPPDATETQQTPDEVDDRVLVTADFRPTELEALAGSATIIDETTLDDRNAAHLDAVLNTAPNVNFATGASRGRFFQIRGIGARSQFVEPSNASVGLIVDGIDLTGLGGAASTLDIDQVEILRGPQGTLFGANALAGLINLVSASPTPEHQQTIGLRLGDYGTRYAETTASGPINPTAGYRVAASKLQSDGFTDNAFLGRRDTAGLDELTVKSQLDWAVGPDVDVELTALYLDIDNGYDAFSLDNTRTTLSDEPGFDRQETWAGSTRVIWRAHPAFDVETTLSHVNADLDYGFDEDWAFEDICEAFECIFGGYTSFDRYTRQTDNTTVDTRLVSTAGEDSLGWVVGAYAKDQTQTLERVYTYAGDFSSDYQTSNQAVYGQLDIPLSEDWAVSAGLRHERFEADYLDSNAASYQQDENLWGGKVSLSRSLASDTWVYALVSKGYKVGGINPDDDVPNRQRRYQTEGLWNHEIGGKGSLMDGRVDWRVAVFYQARDDIQTQQSLVVPVAGERCPCEFIEFQSNAAEGTSQGVEIELNAQLSDRLGVFASLGLLDAKFDDFVSFSHVDADEDTGMGVDLDGRDVPQAPNYNAHLGAVWSLTDRWSLLGELEAKDGFFFSSRHSTRAAAYEQMHLRLSYQANDWDLALWVRNLTDQTIKTRGFGGFGNDPRTGYATEPYYQFGAPRTVGVSAGFTF